MYASAIYVSYIYGLILYHTFTGISLKMEGSQLTKNGQTFLKKKRTIILGMSPGNTFFYKMENLQRIFYFARDNTQKV